MEKLLEAYNSKKALDWYDIFFSNNREISDRLLISNLCKYDNVLDVGCGSGVLIDHVAPKCNNYYGIDIAEESINRAKVKAKMYNNCNLSLQNMLDFEIEEKFSKVFFSGNSFQELLSQTDQIKCLNHVKKFMTKKAELYISLHFYNEIFQTKESLKVKKNDSNSDFEYLTYYNIVADYDNWIANINQIYETHKDGSLIHKDSYKINISLISEREFYLLLYKTGFQIQKCELMIPSFKYNKVYLCTSI